MASAFLRIDLQPPTRWRSLGAAPVQVAFNSSGFLPRNRSPALLVTSSASCPQSPPTAKPVGLFLTPPSLCYLSPCNVRSQTIPKNLIPRRAWDARDPSIHFQRGGGLRASRVRAGNHEAGHSRLADGAACAVCSRGGCHLGLAGRGENTGNFFTLMQGAEMGSHIHFLPHFPHCGRDDCEGRRPANDASSRQRSTPPSSPRNSPAPQRRSRLLARVAR